MPASAHWSQKDECWYIPVSGRDLMEQLVNDSPLEPVRLEFKNGQVWITKLPDPRDTLHSIYEGASAYLEGNTDKDDLKRDLDAIARLAEGQLEQWGWVGRDST